MILVRDMDKTTGKNGFRSNHQFGKTFLAAVGNSYYQVEHILTAVKSLSTSSDTTNEPKSQEPQKDIPCQIVEEIDNLGITSDGKQPKIEEVLADPLCTSEINQLEEGDLHDMMKEGEYRDLHELNWGTCWKISKLIF